MFTAEDIPFIDHKIDQLIKDFAEWQGFDLYNYKERSNVKHNTVNGLFDYIYQQLFFKGYNTPDCIKFNNINYNDDELIIYLINKFISICEYFNKSLGVLSFCDFIGIKYDTLERWENDEKLNPARREAMKKIQGYNQKAQIGLLNDTPVGALAVANNDKKTGLEWSKNAAPQVGQNTVFYIPSERVDRLKLEDGDI